MADVIRKVKLQFYVEGAKEAKVSVEDVEKAVKKVDKAGKEAAAPTSTSGLGALNKATTEMADRFKKATSAVEGIMSSLARVAGAVGLVTGAFALLQAGAEKLNSLIFDTGDRFKVLTDEAVKAKTGLSDLRGSLDAYAQSVGVANGKMLTFVERQRALRLLQSGKGPWTPELVDAKLNIQGQRFLDAEATMGRDETFLQRASNFLTPGSNSAIEAARGEQGEAGRETTVLSLVQQAYQKREADAAALVQSAKGVVIRAGYAINEVVQRGRGTVDRYAGALADFYDKQGKGGGGGGDTDPFMARAIELDKARVGELTARNRLVPGMSSSEMSERQAYREVEREAINAKRRRGERPDQMQVITGDKTAAEMEARNQERLQRMQTAAQGFTDAFASSAASAILFGNSLAKGVNTALKALAQLYAVKALGSLGEAAILAFTNPVAAGKAVEAAGLYTAAAVLASAGAAATGGLRSGGGGGGGGGVSAPSRDDFRDRGRDSREQGPQQITVVIGGKAINDSVVAYSRGAAGSRSQPRVAVVQG